MHYLVHIDGEHGSMDGDTISFSDIDKAKDTALELSRGEPDKNVIFVRVEEKDDDDFVILAIYKNGELAGEPK